MPRFKQTDYGPKSVPVDFARQIVPGSFEHAPCHRIDPGGIELWALPARRRNDQAGAPARDPGVMLKMEKALAQRIECHRSQDSNARALGADEAGAQAHGTGKIRPQMPRRTAVAVGSMHG
jgi:hypothetical protein